MTSHYEDRGVSPHKHEVLAALQNIDPGLFPNAFCKAIPDIWTGSPDHCVLLHSDGAGTKANVAYLAFARHQDPSVFLGIAQDSLVMNLDDLLCVGATGPFVLSNTIGRNAALIPGEVLQVLIQSYEFLAKWLQPYHIEIHTCGGETADVGDLVRTLTVDSTLAVRMRRQDFIDCSRIPPNAAIVGLASSGKAHYETDENSGIGTNGFTAARHELLKSQFRTNYPETFAPQVEHLAYQGDLDLDDLVPETPWTVAQALLSPTRTYAPIIVQLLANMKSSIWGMFHNTGGGLTKCVRFAHRARFIKNNLFEPPPLFRFIQEKSKLTLQEMARVFNMGQRFEVICVPEASSQVIECAAAFGVQAKVIGYTAERNTGPALTIEHQGELLHFD
ncbi:AIR synthase-related protein [Pajaroellobacter abortibovis]|uniref:Phosphoribosylformylglycinamidine cyclo-ligase n=1 Tax=Pajaroellobacter abortibovis TaxID=1882918 RepID=A0A1L6MW24_9BACT|nr:AIR synthase-related protein [Pajaroellobacter abortibovis]APR99726.1 phosphoribosylformylglycinamidine cyclo-ligase [Pajaroellobacter abortibovis]